MHITTKMEFFDRKISYQRNVHKLTNIYIYVCVCVCVCVAVGVYVCMPVGVYLCVLMIGIITGKITLFAR